MTCPKCFDTGVIETGTSDLPCDCPAGDSAVFNESQVRGGPVTGWELKRYFLNNSPQPIRGPIHVTKLPNRIGLAKVVKP